MTTASNWIVRLSTGCIVVRAWTRAAAIKRAIQEECIRVGGLVLFDRMSAIGKMHVEFESCEPRTWWDAEQGYEIDFDDTLESSGYGEEAVLQAVKSKLNKEDANPCPTKP
jgi:hypothetical protein